MTAIDIVAVGAEDGIDFIVALRIAGAEEGDAEPPHQAPEATEAAVAGLEAPGEQQAQFGRQERLCVEQALQHLCVDLDMAGGPARGDTQSVVAAAVQGQHT